MLYLLVDVNLSICIQGDAVLPHTTKHVFRASLVKEISLRVVFSFADLLHRDLANRERQKQTNKHTSTAPYDSLFFFLAPG